MYKPGNELIYSPSDLNAFLENQCVTWLDRFDIEYPGELKADEPEEEDELIRRTGDEHERSFLAGLVSGGSDVLAIDRDDPDAFAKSVQGMHQGREVIYQARLECGEFAGWSDFLFRVEGASELGGWHYEVWDTKLARSLKPYFAIQLCCYAEMLNAIQGRLPEQAGIILGDGERKPLRVPDYWYYYRAVKRAFLDQQRSFNRNHPPAFPGLADYRHWTGHVNRMLEMRDDLARVANIRTSQIGKLSAAGITTLRGLAESVLGLIPGMARGTFDRLRTQARLQRASLPGEPPAFELVQPEPDAPRQGFALLPPPSPGDVCFDIEGYPLIEGGLEYLLGVTLSKGGKLLFRDWWAHDRQQEKASFEAFVDWVYARWKRHPSMHVYHYAAYETTALKRLMCRYASRENEVDELLRSHVFVDLFTVVRQALILGEQAYSLKNVEHLYAPAREGEVATAGASMVYYHRWLTVRDGADWRTSPTLKLIRQYNQVDCESTWKLITWLRERQAASGVTFVPPDPPKELVEETAGRAALAREMLAVIPLDRSADTEHWRVHELLAHLLEFHRRERKSLCWELFRRMEMTEEELIADRECLGGAVRTAKQPVPVNQSLVYEYRFPNQESKLHAGSACLLASDGKTGFEIESLDYDRQLLTVKRGRRKEPPPPRMSLVPDEIIGAKSIEQSIERTVRAFLASGTLPLALADFLYRRAPRIADHGGGPVIAAGADVTSEAIKTVLALDSSTLCIQGPPGSGKTTTGGRIIAELLRRGKRVGISSNSHDAICVLMKAVGEAADRLGVRFTGAKCGEDDREPPHASVKILPNNGDVFDLPQLPMLVGGTAWVFSKEQAVGRFDYLFIDEAGQVSVANLVGMAPAARNIVLLGDQMQLDQPVHGVHPGESGTSILEYYLQGHATVPDHMGIFLPTTFRMRPEICDFISNAVYEGRLKAEQCTSDRRIRFEGPVQYVPQPAGIVHVPVDHSGNTYDCDEEVAVIRRIVAELSGHLLEELGASPRAITTKDILVVAPFNLQARKLKAALDGVRVGTVDKFQGQQAPIVIFSMTSSDGTASPRGIEFLFDKHRLNVAISRAQVLAVVVGSPALERTRCSNLEQMRAVNVYCRAVEAGALGAFGLKTSA